MAVYQNARAGIFTYTIPGLTAGSSVYGAAAFCRDLFHCRGEREFNVAINGTTVLTNFDIYATVGANAALVEISRPRLTAAANRDRLHGRRRKSASLSGIEIRGTSASCAAVPSAPTGLTATTSSSSAIGLSWTAPVHRLTALLAPITSMAVRPAGLPRRRAL